MLARAEGRQSGDRITVELFYDVDGLQGEDQAAIGFPAYWLRASGEVQGPFEHEEQAITVAFERWGATF